MTVIPKWTAAQVHEGNRRLALLRDYLRTNVTSRTFNMRLIGGGPKPELSEKNYCGSIGCMLGHAAMIPALQEVGLTHRWRQNTINNRFSLIVDGEYDVFRISVDEATGLFYDWPDGTSVDPCANAQRLDDFIQERERLLADGKYPVKDGSDEI